MSDKSQVEKQFDKDLQAQREQDEKKEQEKKGNPSVQLALNGTPVYMFNMMSSVSVKREQKDMSGSKSSTKNSDKGVKAKELQVSGVIPYSRKEWLTAIFNFAEAETGKGEQEKYRVSSVTAEAVNMREVQFVDSVVAQEMDSRLAWQVSFTLREVNSVAEKKEERKAKPKVKTQGEKAPVAKSSQASPPSAPAQGQEAGNKSEDNSISKKINDWLGD